LIDEILKVIHNEGLLSKTVESGSVYAIIEKAKNFFEEG